MIDEKNMKKGESILFILDKTVPLWESFEKGTLKQMKGSASKITSGRKWFIAKIEEIYK